MAKSATGNFQEDLIFYLKDLNSPAHEHIEILANCSPFKEPKTPNLEDPAGTCELTSRNNSSQSNYLNNNLGVNGENRNEKANDDDQHKYSQNYKSGPVIWATPTVSTPSHIHLRNFKIDMKTMEALLKAVDAQAANSNSKSLSLTISVCKITNEAFDVLITNGNFSIIKNLTLIGNLPTNNQGVLLQQLLSTPVNFQLLFKTKIESLTLKHWNLTDEFLDNCVPIIQLNNSLQYLNLDFNDFKKRDHIDKILRVNRKLINISMRSGKNLSEMVQKFNEPLSPTLENEGLAAGANSNDELTEKTLDLQENSEKPNSGKKEAGGSGGKSGKGEKDSKSKDKDAGNSKDTSKSAKDDRSKTPSSNDNRPATSQELANLVYPEPEMLVMTSEEVREFRRAKLYEKEVASNNTVPGIFLSEKIERRDKKLYFPGNGVFKSLIY